MAYPESCFESLIGIRGICDATDGNFYLDNIPGIDAQKLANVADGDIATGAKLGLRLIESAAAIMAADVEAIYDGKYKVQSNLVSGCANGRFTGPFTPAVGKTGSMVKNASESSLAFMIIENLNVLINNSGTFHIVVDDGVTQKVIEHTFEAGVQYEITGLNYKTKRKEVDFYFQESGVLLGQISLKRPGGSGCGCGGVPAAISDLVYSGLTNGVETQQAYGFIPCALITCNADDVLCYVAHSAPRMIGMTLLYKTAELYFTQINQANRNNKTVGMNKDSNNDDAKKYNKLYLDKLNGNGTRGVKDIVFSTLQSMTDVCVVCNSLTGSAWAN